MGIRLDGKNRQNKNLNININTSFLAAGSRELAGTLFRRCPATAGPAELVSAMSRAQLAKRVGNCGFYIQTANKRQNTRGNTMQNPHKLLRESVELFQKKMIEEFGITKFGIPNQDDAYDREITGEENIARILSSFSSLGHYLNIDDSRTRRGPDAFNSIKFDNCNKVLQIGRFDTDNDGNVKYAELFSLVPKALYVHYCPNPEHCVLVLTNRLNRKLGMEDILTDPEKCDYCDLVDTKTATIADISKYVNPLLIYPKGSLYLNEAPYFLNDLIAKEELNSLDVKS